ncbi:MAG: ORF6N domain-containing protein [Calditrichales bacterium]|nr:ORF6N domain-containing protein [Calditrichales bacterium]
MDNSDLIANSGNSAVEQTKAAIRTIRGQDVILASDVARIYGETTKRINERARRHPGKFPPDFMIQLTKSEFDELRSQSATSKVGRGGTQYLPYAFTEHGVLQIANLINTDMADSVSVFVIRAFVEMRKTIIAQQKALAGSKALVSAKSAGSKSQKAVSLHKELIPKLQTTIDRILDSVIDIETGTTVKDEALDILKESINHLKEQLRHKGLQNEEITARVTKLLAEAENQRATARKTRAESEQLEFMNTIKKLRLVLEAQLIMISNENTKDAQRLKGLVEVLRDVAKLS